MAVAVLDHMVSHGKHQLANAGELADGKSHATPRLPPAATALHFTGVRTEGPFRPPKEQAWLLSLSGPAAEEIPCLMQKENRSTASPGQRILLGKCLFL